jgi:hypothetical protein
MLQLARVPQLTHLNLEGIALQGLHSFDCFKDKAALQPLHAVMSDLLQQLPQLSVLKLAGVHIGATAVQHLSAMTRLQELRISLCDGMEASCMDSLPSSMTSLYIQDNRSEDPDRRRMKILPPRLHRLTSLRHLHTNYGAVQPSLLTGLTQLQHLQLECCSLLPTGPFEWQGLAADADGDHDAAMAELLAALQYLTQLQHLEVGVPGFAEVEIPVVLFSALTASSCLTQLCMAAEYGQTLPPGAAQHIFPADRQLPQLSCVDFSTKNDWELEDFCIATEALAALASCCPNLEQLKIIGVWGSDVDAATLLQLPASCIELEVGGPRFTDAAAAVVAQLTHLKKLTLCNTAAGLTDVGLLELTSLRELSALALYHCKALAGFSEAVVPNKPDQVTSDDYDGGSLCLSDDRVSHIVRVSRCHCPASNGPGRDRQLQSGAKPQSYLGGGFKSAAG